MLLLVINCSWREWIRREEQLPSLSTTPILLGFGSFCHGAYYLDTGGQPFILEHNEWL